MKESARAFDNNKLIVLTLLISGFAFLLLFDNDLAMLVCMLAGFTYTIVLFLSLNDKVSLGRFFKVFLLLGIANFFSIYAIVFHMVIPFFQVIGPLVPSSLFGVLITWIALKKFWNLQLTKKDLAYTCTLIFIASVGGSMITLLTRGNPDSEFDDLGFALNSILWWLMFTLALVQVKPVIEETSAKDSQED